MGLSPSAELIWGIPIVAFTDEWDDERDEPKATPFWDPDEEDWREFDGLVVIPYGHYEDPDNQRAILASPRIPSFTGDAWTPKGVGIWDLDVEAYHAAAKEDFEDAFLAIEDESLDEGLLGQSGWHLVASYG